MARHREWNLFDKIAGGPGNSAIVERAKGTGLRPCLDPHDEAQREGFLADHGRRIARLSAARRRQGAAALSAPLRRRDAQGLTPS